MRKIKQIAFGVFQMLAVCLLWTACADNESGYKQVIEGLPVSLNFKLVAAAPTEVKTRASAEVETKVENLLLLFYRADNSDAIPWTYKVNTSDLGEYKPIEGASGTYYEYNITISEDQGLTSGSYEVYAIANWNKGFWNTNMDIERLKNLKKTEMDDECVKKMSSAYDIIATSALLTGKYQNSSDSSNTLILNPGENTMLSIYLRRSYAKISFEFKNGNGVKFTPTSWEVHNYSLTSTLFERNGWKNQEGKDDYTNGTNPGELQWKGAGTMSDTDNYTEFNVPYDANAGIMFYMPENVQAAKKSADDALKANVRLRDRKDYAPDCGTYVVVNGLYEGPISQSNTQQVSGEVTYTIYLGDFSSNGSSDNYTVRRNARYKYNVTIEGVNSIITKCQNASVDTQPGANGHIVNVQQENTFVLDAHYDEGKIHLTKEMLETLRNGDTEQQNITIQVRTPYTNRTYKNITELQNDNSGTLGHADVGWLQFSPMRTAELYNQYGANDVPLYDLNTLIDVLQTGNYKNKNGESYFFFDKNSDAHLQVFANEYFYYTNDDGETSIENLEAMPLIDFINAPDRVINLANNIYSTSDGKSSYTITPIFSCRQQSIKTVFNLEDQTLNPFGIENMADAAVGSEKVALGKNTGDIYPASVDDGKNGNYDPNSRGRMNSLAILQYMKDNNPKGKGQDVLWSDFWNYENYKAKDEYNYGIYRWLTRNRDINKNGIIDNEDIRWYLPSAYQFQCFWLGLNALAGTVQPTFPLYFTSTQSKRTYWAHEGTFGEYKADHDEEAKQLVKAMRTLGKMNMATSTVSMLASDPTNGIADERIICVRGLDDRSTRTSGSYEGEYRTHAQGSNINIVPEAFLVAKEALMVTVDGTQQDTFTAQEVWNNDLCANYSEEADGTDRGKWRIPNQRELMLMLIKFKEKEGKGNFPLPRFTAARTYYDGDTSNPMRPYYIQVSNYNNIDDGTYLTKFISTNIDYAKGYTGQNTRILKIVPVRDWPVPAAVRSSRGK